MKNELSTSVKMSSLSAPTVDRDAMAALAVALNLLTREYPAAPEMLSEPLAPRLRAALETRRSVLQAALGAASVRDRLRMGVAISGLLAAFPGASVGGLEGTVAKYVQVCEDLPAWAVIEACSLIESGRAEGVSLDFRPMAPRVRSVAADLLMPWLAEFHNLRRVLNAPTMEPENEAMREKIKGLFKTFADGFRMGKFRKEGET